MLFYNGKIKIMGIYKNKLQIINMSDEPDNNDINNDNNINNNNVNYINIKSAATYNNKYSDEYIILTNDNKLLLFDDCYGRNSHYVINLKININPSHVNIIKKNGYTDYICALYTLKNNKIVIINYISVDFNNNKLNKFGKTKIIKFNNIIKFEPTINNYYEYEIHDNNNILITNKDLKILDKFNTKNINRETNNILINKYYYSYVTNNNIYLCDNITKKIICTISAQISISRIIHLDYHYLYVFDDVNNLHVYYFSEYRKIIYYDHNIINLVNDNIRIVNYCEDTYIYCNSGKIYCYDPENKKINLIYADKTNITFTSNKYLDSLQWNIINHNLFDSQIKANVKLILLCNKYTFYNKLCKPVLYNILTLSINK